jgi:hypothetical protein
MENEISKVNIQARCMNEVERKGELINTTLRLIAIVSQRLNESAELMSMNKDKFQYSTISNDSFPEMEDSHNHVLNQTIENSLVTIEEIANASEGLEIISEGLHNLIWMFTKTKSNC